MINIKGGINEAEENKTIKRINETAAVSEIHNMWGPEISCPPRPQPLVCSESSCCVSAPSSSRGLTGSLSPDTTLAQGTDTLM